MSERYFCNRPGCDRTWESDPVLAVTCPTCHARPGVACKRPSGHGSWGKGEDFHAARDLAADAEGHYGPCPLGICGQKATPVQADLFGRAC